MAAGLARNAVIYLIANALNAGVPFLLLPVLTRILTPADYGVIAMFAVTISVFSALVGLSVHGAIGVRYFQLPEADLREFVTACIAILAICTCALALLVLAFGFALVPVTGLPRDWLLIGVFVAACQIMGQMRLSLWQVQGQPWRYAAFQGGQTLSNALLSLYFIFGVGLAWQGRLIGQSLALTVFGVLGLALLWRGGFIARAPAVMRHGRDALRFGIPLIPHVMGALLIVSVDRFIIVGLMGLESAGIYMVAVQLGQVLGLLTDAFNKAYAPWLMARLARADSVADADTGDVPRDRIVRGTYIYFAYVIGAALIMGLAAPWIVDVMAGAAFAQAQSVVIYIALGYAFSGCYLMVTNYLFFESKTALLAYVTFAAGAVNIVLTYVLVSVNGLAGAGQAFMISQLLAFLGTWWLSHRVHPMPWKMTAAPIPPPTPATPAPVFNDRTTATKENDP